MFDDLSGLTDEQLEIVLKLYFAELEKHDV